MARLTESSNESTIKVRIAPIMGEVREFVLPVDTTVEEALRNAGYQENSEVRVTTAAGENQTINSNAAVLDDGDTVTVISSGKVEAGL